ncbi:MAG TPA: 5'-methylthioadenosine/S-adenosylhomocysteine nucleosidase [Polyangiaceae bacterium]|nr:5'-methylthioadenosine/S-adenosylhomocysteine nucleosidase [Polyangiaceae bacterium]
MTASPILVTMALEVEAQGLFHARGAEVLFTGIGKVNAAYRLARRLAAERALGRRPLVVNLGTAGSRAFPRGSVVACRRFAQRDMDVTGLGFALGHTPFEEDVPAVLEFPEYFPELLHGLCGSGDRFEAHSEALSWDVIDMEAYALAKVCFLEGLPFASVKFITDGADGNAGVDWHASLPEAARAFLRVYEELAAKLSTMP